MAVTSAIKLKINLRLIVYKIFIRHTNTNTPDVYLQRITFSCTPEEAMLAELAKACIY